MPARKRHKPGGQQPETSFDMTTRSGRRSAEASAAAQFAARREREKEEERARSRAHREAAEREQRRRTLAKEKDRAADRLKEVRRRGASAEQRAEAEAGYRAALDAVLRDEQGLPPLEENEGGAEPGPSAPGVADGPGEAVEDVADVEQPAAEADGKPDTVT